MANNNINKPPVDGDSLLSYLNNELSKADKHKLEEQMLEDEFLADAAEGLGMVKNKAALAANIAAINAGVSKSLNSSASATPAKSFLSVVGNTAAIAATVALLVGAAYFISQYSSTNNNKELALANKKEQQPQFAPLNDGSRPPTEESPAADTIASTATVTENNKVFAPNVNYYKYTPVTTDNVLSADEAAPAEDITLNKGAKDIYVAEPAKKNVEQDLDLSMYGPASNNNFNQAPAKLSTKTISSPEKSDRSKTDKKLKYRNEDVSTGDDAPGVYMDGVLIKKDNDDKPATTQQATTATRSTVTGKKESTPTEITDKALNYYKNGDYKGALGELEILLKKEPGNMKAIYYSGMANKYLGRENKALDLYNKIPAGTTYYENAQWEKAQILKSQKKTDQAILALQEVVKVNGTLKTRAENLIKELKAKSTNK